MSKRKRDDLDDDELITPGKQILPVANLPDDFDGVPADGFEYLFTVRRDARKLPLVTRAHNPYETSTTTVLPSTNITTLTHPSLPSEEWRAVYVTHFKNFRQKLKRPEAFAQDSCTKLMPDRQERDLWWAFLAGRPESEWNPPKQPKKKKVKGLHALQAFVQHEPVHDEGEVELALRVDPTESFPTPSGTPVGSDDIEEPAASNESHALACKPRAPTPLLLKHIDQRYSLHLLMYFAHWINQNLQNALPRLSETHAQWMFVLLALVDDHISADSMNTLRNLVRANIALLKTLLQEEASRQLTPSDNLLSPKSCWLIITTIVDIWGQLDLWVDAQSMLRSIQSVT